MVLVAAALAASAALSPAWADPPPWAPAHGWRRHHEAPETVIVEPPPPPVYVVPAPQPQPVYVAPAPLAQAPWGLSQSTCSRDLIGAALGGAAGGLIGSQFGHRDGKTAATIGGVVAGILVGGAIGQAMDEVDQNCAGAALTYAPDGHPIAWSDPDGDRYTMTPVRSFHRDGEVCREYHTAGMVGGAQRVVTGTACRRPDGAWQLMN